ncbi:MAG: energy-coupled thiamine transporter ThiT, partial [Synergistaceae bacterium]|nr:energy-coupled thiamine transporter ThiT [Synergistaceae bacterium]
IAIGFALSCFRLYRMPMGGSVVLCSILPLVAFSHYAGARKGVVVCLAYGILQLMQGGYVIHPIQGALDYLVAYGALAAGGVRGPRRLPERYRLCAAILLASVLRWIAHSISGVVFFADGANGASPLLYSAAYNAYLFPEAILSAALALTPAVRGLFAPLRGMRSAGGCAEL